MAEVEQAPILRFTLVANVAGGQARFGAWRTVHNIPVLVSALMLVIVPGVGFYRRETTGFPVCGSVSFRFRAGEEWRMDRWVPGSEKRLQLEHRRGFTSDIAGRMILVGGNEEEGNMKNNEPYEAVSTSGRSLPKGLVRAVTLLFPAISHRWGL